MTLAKPFRDSNPEVEAQYKALLRSLRRTKGFGIVFVQCTPNEATRLIASIKEDLPQKNIGVLNLSESIDNLYQLVEARPDRETLNILFIQGIEKSLEPYVKPGYGGEGDYYKLDTVPRILSHLNQQRENFRDHFSNICFVFIVPRFALKYFIQRAPDFFDWQSRVSVFPIEPDLLEQASSRLLGGSYDEYREMTDSERNQKLLDIHKLLEEEYQTSELKAELFFEQGNLFMTAKEYEAAIASYDKALKLKPDYYEAWYGRGRAFRWLERYEEAISSYDEALKLKPDYCKAWYSRGRSLKRLECYQEAIDSFNEALKLEPDNYLAWYNKGNVLVLMKRYEEAIASYEKALEIRPDMPDVWNNRGNILATLGRYEKAIESLNKSLEYSPDNAMAFYNKACCYTVWGKLEEAIENLRFSINLNSNKYRELAKIDSDFDDIRDDERFQAVINES